MLSLFSIPLAVRERAIFSSLQVQVTSADISPHLSVQQETEQQLQVQVS